MYNQIFINVIKNGQVDLWHNLLGKSKIKKIKAKEIVFYEHTPGENLYYLVKGQLEVFLTSKDGKILVINDLTDGCLFGELSIILDIPRSASVRAVKNSEIKIISKQAFFDELKINHQLSFSLISILAERVMILSNDLRSMALEDVYSRVKLLLQNLATTDLNGDTMLNKITHNNIALHVGSSREMISKIFKELINGGYIEVIADKIRINRPLPKKF